MEEGHDWICSSIEWGYIKYLFYVLFPRYQDVGWFHKSRYSEQDVTNFVASFATLVIGTIFLWQVKKQTRKENTRDYFSLFLFLVILHDAYNDTTKRPVSLNNEPTLDAAIFDGADPSHTAGVRAGATSGGVVIVIRFTRWRFLRRGRFQQRQRRLRVTSSPRYIPLNLGGQRSDSQKCVTDLFAAQQHRVPYIIWREHGYHQPASVFDQNKSQWWGWRQYWIGLRQHMTDPEPSVGIQPPLDICCKWRRVRIFFIPPAWFWIWRCTWIPGYE